jgi:hypothetical protein
MLCLDADRAGLAASAKNARAALLAGMRVKAVRLPEGKDPADVVSEDPHRLHYAGEGIQERHRILPGRAFRSRTRPSASSPRARSADTSRTAEILREFPHVEDDVNFLDELYERFTIAGIDILEGGMLEDNADEYLATRNIKGRESSATTPSRYTSAKSASTRS